ncbi:MAG: LicD family protein [Oscillospiraceae bacterium]|nr:LicD family protein [Candidatus Equicaccousia limihippi]
MIRICDNRTELDFTEYHIPYKIGCWIDVFPIDGTYEDIKKRQKQFKRIRLLNDLFLCCLTKFGIKRRSKKATVLQYAILPALPFIRMYGYRNYLDKIDKVARECDYEKSEYVAVIGGRAGVKEAMKKSDMEPAVLVDFNGHKFYTMKNYDQYLTNLYGDYMTPPSEKDRASRHIIEVCWKD